MALPVSKTNFHGIAVHDAHLSPHKHTTSSLLQHCIHVFTENVCVDWNKEKRDKLVHHAVSFIGTQPQSGSMVVFSIFN